VRTSGGAAPLALIIPRVAASQLGGLVLTPGSFFLVELPFFDAESLFATGVVARNPQALNPEFG
jgi:hypothetical protein